MEKRAAFIGFVIIALSALGAYMLALSPGEEAPELVTTAEAPEGAHVVTLTTEGFVPDELAIRAGETVAFTNTTGELFWPASNLHPSHALYPEFDPREPVQPNAVWSFTFTTPGEWKYHDHLAPYYTGVITVTE